MMNLVEEGVRKRKPENGSAADRLQLAMAVPLLRLKQLPTRGKWLLGFTLVLSVFLWMAIISSLARNHLTNEDFLESRKCPACYGMTMCHPLLIGDVHLTGFSRLRLLDMVNVKNVHFGTYLDSEVVLKKLGHNDELAAFDAGICEETGREKGCDLGRVLFASKQLQGLRNADLEPDHLKGLSDFTTCPSKRLVARIQDKFQEKTEPGRRMLFRDKVMLLTILKINAEPLLLQTFPATEGWPFPPYMGACGRFIVEGYAGKMLGEYFHAPFHKRVDLAYQIFKIANQLTNNQDNYALYWTDLSYDNLAVDSEGKVTVIDVENIQVVDKLAVAKAKKPGWDELHESRYDQCKPGHNCLSFQPTSLCEHVDADHNYYAVCRNLLASVAEDGLGKSGGLLHDMPDYAKDDYELEYLLDECARPSRPKGRIHVKDRLLDTLDKLRIYALEKDELISEKEEKN